MGDRTNWLVYRNFGVVRGRVTSARIEFAGSPIHVAVIEGRRIWHGEDVSGFEVQKPVRVDWKRPFDAKWRISTVVAEGKQTTDLMTRSQSYELLYKPDDVRRGGKTDHERYLSLRRSQIWKNGFPQVSEEKTFLHIYPAWFDGEETWVAMYTDDPRSVARGKKSSGVENNIYQE